MTITESLKSHKAGRHDGSISLPENLVYAGLRRNGRHNSKTGKNCLGIWGKSGQAGKKQAGVKFP